MREYEKIVFMSMIEDDDGNGVRPSGWDGNVTTSSDETTHTHAQVPTHLALDPVVVGLAEGGDRSQSHQRPGHAVGRKEGDRGEKKRNNANQSHRG